MDDLMPKLNDRTAWALFLDIDGTLLDLAPTPCGVIIPPDLPELLEQLEQKLSGALALISGRSLDDIDRLLGWNGDAAGIHGAQWRRGGHPPVQATALPSSLIAAITAGASRLQGIVVEHKPGSAALHFTAVPDRADDVRALANRMIATAEVPLRLLHGKGVVEIVPAHAGKGSAIERFMRKPPYVGRRPVFIGDDVTDEDGFAAVNRLGGVSLHVGDSRTAARHRLTSPEAVRRWLTKLNTRLKDGTSHELA